MVHLFDNYASFTSEIFGQLLSNYSLYATNLNIKAVSFFFNSPYTVCTTLQFNDTGCFELMIHRKGLAIWCCTRCNQQ